MRMFKLVIPFKHLMPINLLQSLIFIIIITLANANLINTNILNGPDNVVFQGKNNKVNGQNNQLVGSTNQINGNTNSVLGFSNILSGEQNFVSGSGNKIIGTGNLVSGKGNIILGPGQTGQDAVKLKQKFLSMASARGIVAVPIDQLIYNPALPALAQIKSQPEIQKGTQDKKSQKNNQNDKSYIQVESQSQNPNPEKSKINQNLETTPQQYLLLNNQRQKQVGSQGQLQVQPQIKKQLSASDSLQYSEPAKQSKQNKPDKSQNLRSQVVPSSTNSISQNKPAISQNQPAISQNQPAISQNQPAISQSQPANATNPNNGIIQPVKSRYHRKI